VRPRIVLPSFKVEILARLGVWRIDPDQMLPVLFLKSEIGLTGGNGQSSASADGDRRKPKSRIPDCLLAQATRLRPPSPTQRSYLANAGRTEVSVNTDHGVKPLSSMIGRKPADQKDMNGWPTVVYGSGDIKAVHG
jgi:hypothetical protein